jgi:hypothetical protein
MHLSHTERLGLSSPSRIISTFVAISAMEILSSKLQKLTNKYLNKLNNFNIFKNEL